MAINRRIAINIYKYLVGAWNALYEKAREELYITREDLRKRLRIRLYLGGEHSCLQGRRKHYIEHCLTCSLYRRYAREWGGSQRHRLWIPGCSRWLATAPS
ncbi:MAG: hypothetical protein DRO12_05110 [Thermoprotei archaeon]|nr:MAG: hypothetical protein DRO12_05110 [Thermoprotei archaeon]